jgi:TolB-like protein
MPFDYVALGEQQLKGFDEPVRAYTVSPTEGTEVPPAETQAATEPPRSHGRTIKTGITAIALLTIGIMAWWQPWNPTFTPASVERMKFPLPEKPSIAVLPFNNLSGDPKQDFFSDGITEDIITSLSKIPNMFVIARNSTYTYKGKPVKVQQVAEDLGIRYVLEGSVQRSENKVRITAQLIDALSGRHLWAERYDRDFKEIFALQDDVTKNVVTALQVELTAGEQARVWRRQTENTEAYELFLRGDALLRTPNRANVTAAKALYEKAVELDPNFASAWLRLSLIHQHNARFGWSENRAQSLSLAADAVQKALAINDTQPEAYYALANIAIVKGQYEQAIGHCGKALALGPTAEDMHGCARIWTYVGRPQEAIELITEAMRRNPYFRGLYFFPLGNAHRLMGNYDDAIAAFKAWGDADQKSLSPLIMLANAYVDAGRMEEARATVKEILKRSPKCSMKVPTRVLRYKDPAEKERILTNLRAAGVPE